MKPRQNEIPADTDETSSRHLAETPRQMKLLQIQTNRQQSLPETPAEPTADTSEEEPAAAQSEGQRTIAIG